MTDDLGAADTYLDPDDITRGLNEAASRVRIGGGDPSAVIALANRRLARRRRAISGLVALALVMATVGVLQASDDEGIPVGAGAGSTFRRGALGLDWRTVDPGSALGMSLTVTRGQPIYALSTAPGERFPQDGKNLSRVVWRSEDGIDWTAVSTLTDDLYLSDLSNTDGRVYAVGTAPAAAAVAGGKPVSELIVGWSDDGAKRWQKRALPLDWATLSAHGKSQVVATSIATGPKGTLAVALLSTTIDVRPLLPEDTPAWMTWARDADNVYLLGAMRNDVCPTGGVARDNAAENVGGEVGAAWCDLGSERQKERPLVIAPQDARQLIATYSWAELGVAGDLLASMQHQPVAFFAPEGSTDFERVALPPFRNVMPDLDVHASDDGFSVLASTVGDQYGRGSSELAFARSSDGRTWRQAPTPPSAGWVSAFGRLGATAAFVASDESGSSLYVSEDPAGEGGWVRRRLSELVDPAALGDRQVHASAAAFGPFGVAVHAIVNPLPDSGEMEASSRLLLSRDGVTWEDIDVHELVGRRGASITRVMIVDDEVLIAASLPTDGGAPDAVREQLVLVGK